MLYTTSSQSALHTCISTMGIPNRSLMWVASRSPQACTNFIQNWECGIVTTRNKSLMWVVTGESVTTRVHKFHSEMRVWHRDNSRQKSVPDIGIAKIAAHNKWAYVKRAAETGIMQFQQRECETNTYRNHTCEHQISHALLPKTISPLNIPCTHSVPK
jgi:hypothetical protein